MNKIIIITLILLAGITLFSEALEVEAFVDKNRIGQNDYLQLTFLISGDRARSVKAPDISKITDFKIKGQTSSFSSNFEVVNGKMKKSITKSYVYTLYPVRKGTLQIPAITITDRNLIFSSDPIRIQVIKDSTEPAPKIKGQTSNKKSDMLSDNLFVLTEVDKRTVYKGEPIRVSYKIYSRYDISNMSYASEPNFESFWKEDVFVAERIQFRPVTRSGVRYEEMLLKTIMLTPSEAGRKVIQPLEMSVDIRTQSHSFFDFGSSRNYKVRSKPVIINVLELPEKNRPASFSGAVGNFRLNSDISKDSLRVGDSFTYTIEINGRGNLSNIEIPKLPEIEHLRFLDPEITSEINRDKISGKKIIKYLVIAQETGEFIIPSLKFSYFDTNKKHYKTASTKSYRIKVAEGDMTFVSHGTAQKLITREGADIGFIISDSKLENFKVKFNRTGYWFWYLLAILTLPLSSWYSHEKAKLSSNERYQRQKMANRILKKYLKQADGFAETNSIEFYAAAQTGLSSYLADKLHIARGSSTEIIISEIEKRNFPTNLVDKIAAIFQRCSQARFMPGGFAQENISSDYDALKKNLTDIAKVKI